MDPVDRVRAKVASDLSELSEEQEMAAITEVLAKKGLDQWPLFSSAADKEGRPQSVEDVLLKTGLSSVFDIDVVKSKTGQSIILLGPISSRLHYNWHMLDVLQNSSKPDNLTSLQLSALKTAVKMLKPDAADDQVEQYANSVVEFADEWVKVPWLKLLNNEFKKVGTIILDGEMIEVLALDNLKDLVEFYSKNLVSAYNSLGAFEAHNLLWYSSKAYRDAIGQLLGKKAGELEDMAGSCGMLLAEMMPEVVSKLYIENNFNDDTKWQIWNMVPYVGYPPWLMNTSFVDGLYEKGSWASTKERLPVFYHSTVRRKCFNEETFSTVRRRHRAHVSKR
ncbi:hypothetical protein MTO96_034206 [Rhipicephalus appendiculatus]